MNKILKNSNEVLNFKNLIITLLISIKFCSVSAYIISNNSIYNISFVDYFFKILSNRGFVMGLILVFVAIGYFSLYNKDVNECEIIRYERLDRYYKAIFMKSLILIIMYIGIIFLNIIIASLIKSNKVFSFSEIVYELHYSSDLYGVFMNKELLGYNWIVISVMYIIILFLFLFIILNSLNLINCYKQNKILVALVALMLISIIIYDSNFGENKTLTSYLMLNHIEFGSGGFKLFDNLYLNNLTSIIYLASINIITFGIGTKILRKQELFNYNKSEDFK